MEIDRELARTRTAQQEIVSKINILEQEKQDLLQEALRLDGEVRLLTKLAKELKEKVK